jgi:signal transduction histidine kinase
VVGSPKTVGWYRQSVQKRGQGLGLALTKKIVELQKGSISVKSDHGKGSTFTVILPILEGNNPDA